jgi:Flp pilus assembly protein TadG
MFRRAEDGTTAIEFGLLAIPFIFLMLIIIELGMILVTEYAIQFGVEEASRTLRTAGPGTMTGVDFRDMICNRAAVVVDCNERLGLSVTSAKKFRDVANPRIANIEPGGVSAFTPGTAGDAVVVIATYDWAFISLFMRPMANLANPNARRLHGIAAFRTELLE